MAATTESEIEAPSVKTAPETPPARQNAAASDGRRGDGGRVKRNVNPEMMAHFEASMARHHRLLELLSQHD